MEGRSYAGSRFWVVRIDPGEDVLSSLKDFVRQNEIRSGVVISGYGTFSKVRLHWVEHDRFPTDNRFEEMEGGMELMSMNGIIADGDIHIHFTASTPEGAFGGHLEEGCICYVLVEVCIAELEGGTLRRETVEIAEDEDGNPVMGPRLAFD